jgi:predicted O-methyltransferase YrrM
MPVIQKFISVVHRRRLAIDSSKADTLSLIEPLFAIDTHMSFEERCHFFEMATSLPGGFVACEIGSYLGASTCFLAAAARIRRGHVHAVDTWKNDAMPDEPVEDTWERFLQNTAPFREFITAHRGAASSVRDRVPAVHLLFIDGDHSHAGTLAHLVDYVPKILPGGLLAMHDFDMESVRTATREYFADRPPQPVARCASLQVFKLPDGPPSAT